jgi:hypothetical protein
MSLKTADPRHQDLGEFFPMTRDELSVPTIPHIRLATPVATDFRKSVSAPHIGMTPATEPHHAAFTVAARSLSVPDSTLNSSIGTSSPIPSSGQPLVPVPIDSDVCFVTRASRNQPSLEEMARQAFAPGQSPLLSPGAAPAVQVTPATQAKSKDYPYWVVALVQVVIGTLLVILVVKFANLMRESSEYAPRQVLAPNPSDSSRTSERSRVSLLGQSDTSRQTKPFQPYGF